MKIYSSSSVTAVSTKWVLTTPDKTPATICDEGHFRHFLTFQKGEYILIVSRDGFNTGDLFLHEDYARAELREARLTPEDPKSKALLAKAPKDIEGIRMIAITGEEAELIPANALLKEYGVAMPNAQQMVWAFTGKKIPQM